MADEISVPKRIIGEEVVQCPITKTQRSIVKLSFCKSECKFFVKFVEDESSIECSYPRRLEVISVYGK